MYILVTRQHYCLCDYIFLIVWPFSV